MNDKGTRTLRDIAQLASDRHDGVRGRALDREAKRLGLRLSYTTVDKILAGTYRSQPGPETLDALAALAGVDRAEVYEAAGVPLPMSSFAEQLPPDADLLTARQRDSVLAVVRQFAEANKALHERERGEEHARSAPIATPDVDNIPDEQGDEVNARTIDDALAKLPKGTQAELLTDLAEDYAKLAGVSFEEAAQIVGVDRSKRSEPQRE